MDRDGHSDPKELLRSAHQPAKEQEHPTAPFAGLLSVQKMFLCGLELGKDVWLQEDTGKVLLLGKGDGKMDAKEMLR